MPYDPLLRSAGWVRSRSRAEELRVLVFAGGILLVGGAFLALAFVDAPLYAYVPLVLALVALRRAGDAQIEVALRWLRGSRAEAAVGDVLDNLRRESYIVMHDIEQPYEGNIDHFVNGRSGAFIVETKYRRYEDRDLVKAKRQAAKLARELGVFVTPVLCLATRSYGPRNTRGVWVMGREQLLPWIRTQSNKSAPSDVLARFADAL